MQSIYNNGNYGMDVYGFGGVDSIPATIGPSSAGPAVANSGAYAPYSGGFYPYTAYRGHKPYYNNNSFSSKLYRQMHGIRRHPLRIKRGFK